MNRDSSTTIPTELRTGFTTGACATAAAKGAALMLHHQITVSKVSIVLPDGTSATFTLSGQLVSADQASCFVIKDAGDDPDITNGAEVHAIVRRLRDDQIDRSSQITLVGGIGVGRATKPGLAISPGDWAINPVPRRMIKEAVCSSIPTNENVLVTISIPDGEERAKKTLNARLGIMGGLSILGTTGIVRPISAKAWTDTLDAALDVAKASGCNTVVLSTGRTSELAVQKHFKSCIQEPRQDSLFGPVEPTKTCHDSLKEEAFIMMGDHIAYALKACQKRDFTSPIIACQFAKLLKIACGHENTHASASELDLDRLLDWATSAQVSPSVIESISRAHTAREIAIACSFDSLLLETVFKRAIQAVTSHAPLISPEFALADYSGNCTIYKPLNAS